MPALPDSKAAGAASQPGDWRVEAARYVLFGRILPTLRHALVGELQALRFGVRILNEASDKPVEFGNAIQRLEQASGRGIAGVDAITRWFQPDPDAPTVADQAVDECLELLNGEWQMRGIALSQRRRVGRSRVRGWPFREVLAGCLVALTDDLPGAGDIDLSVRVRGAALWLTLRGDPSDREGESARSALPRRLRWEDVDALAAAHSLTLRRRGRRVAVRFPALDAES